MFEHQRITEYDSGMRTTLDIDERVLAVARSRSASSGISLGTAVSELALKGVEAELAAVRPAAGGFPTLPSVPGHLITDEMVGAALAED